MNQKQEKIPTKMMPEFIQEEQILWQRILKKGLIFKKIVEVQVITNMAVRLNKQVVLPLSDIDHVVLTDKHTIRDGTYQGYSISVGKGMRMYTGAGRGKNVPFADMVFFKHGAMVLILQDVQDASGVKQMIQAANPHIR